MEGEIFKVSFLMYSGDPNSGLSGIQVLNYSLAVELSVFRPPYIRAI